MLFSPFAVCSVIVLLAQPAQIVSAVVQAVAVYVVNGSADRRIRVRAKRLSYETADKKML